MNNIWFKVDVHCWKSNWFCWIDKKSFSTYASTYWPSNQMSWSTSSHCLANQMTRFAKGDAEDEQNQFHFGWFWIWFGIFRRVWDFYIIRVFWWRFRLFHQKPFKTVYFHELDWNSIFHIFLEMIIPYQVRQNPLMMVQYQQWN